MGNLNLVSDESIQVCRLSKLILMSAGRFVSLTVSLFEDGGGSATPILVKNLSGLSNPSGPPSPY